MARVTITEAAINELSNAVNNITDDNQLYQYSRILKAIVSRETKKRPKRIKVMKTNTKEYICPACRDFGVVDVVGRTLDFCYLCGQAIDWNI